MEVDTSAFLQELSRVQAQLRARQDALAVLKQHETALTTELHALHARLAEARLGRARAEVALFAAQVAHHTHKERLANTQRRVRSRHAKAAALHRAREKCRAMVDTAQHHESQTAASEVGACKVERVRRVLAVLWHCHRHKHLIMRVSAMLNESDFQPGTDTIEGTIAACLRAEPPPQ